MVRHPTLVGLLASTLAFQAVEALAQTRGIVVVPLGDPEPELASHVARSLQKHFKLQIELGRNQPMPADAWYPPRKRWRAEKILDALDEYPSKPGYKVTAVTEAPISTTKGKVEDWGIAGLGSMSGKSSVLTAHIFRRYKKNARKTYLRYMEGLVLHEVGHTLGLEHCPLDRCVMADAKGNAIRSAQRSINEFCPRCFSKIRQHLRAPEPRGNWSREEYGARSDPRE